MAQLRDTIVDGNLEVTNDISLKTNSKSIKGIHPDTGVESRMLHMSENGDTVVGYDGYANENGDTYIYGNDVACYVASADSNFCPYYRAGDKIDFTGAKNAVRASGYVTNAGQNVVFTIPITKPVIGSPSATAVSGKGFVLRQNNKYTHGSASSTFITPTSYTVESGYNSGFIVTAIFDVTTDVINNNPIGIYWDGTIELS